MSESPDPRKLRPWYVLVAMIVVWIVGLFGATSSCSELTYLRGDEEARSSLDRRIAVEDHPMLETELARQRARLVAMGEHHERAFPIALADLLLQGLLIVAAGAVIAGRRGSRALAVQALLANAALVVVSFLALTPVREAAVEAAARKHAATVEEAPPLETLRAEQRVVDLERSGFEISLYLLAIFILTRRRARRYFEAIEAPVGDPEES